MMRNPPPLLHAQFGRADIEIAIHLERIAVHHFSLDASANWSARSLFPDSGGSHHCNHRAAEAVFL